MQVDSGRWRTANNMLNMSQIIADAKEARDRVSTWEPKKNEKYKIWTSSVRHGVYTIKKATGKTTLYVFLALSDYDAMDTFDEYLEYHRTKWMKSQAKPTVKEKMIKKRSEIRLIRVGIVDEKGTCRSTDHHFKEHERKETYRGNFYGE